jgi:hypothetical protein
MGEKNKIASSFIVRESRGINLFASSFFLLLSFSLLFYNDLRNSTILSLLIVSTFFGLLFLIKGIKGRIIFEISDTGIYYYGVLITSWEFYVNSYFKAEENKHLEYKTYSYFLFIEYLQPGNENIFISKMPLTATQSKSEEAIVHAIKVYSEKI